MYPKNIPVASLNGLDHLQHSEELSLHDIPEEKAQTGWKVIALHTTPT